jgi:hypothetical protein
MQLGIDIREHFADTKSRPRQQFLNKFQPGLLHVMDIPAGSRARRYLRARIYKQRLPDRKLRECLREVSEREGVTGPSLHRSMHEIDPSRCKGCAFSAGR